MDKILQIGSNNFIISETLKGCNFYLVTETCFEEISSLLKEAAEKYPEGTFFDSGHSILKSSGYFTVEMPTADICCRDCVVYNNEAKLWAPIINPKFKIGNSVRNSFENTDDVIVSIGYSYLNSEFHYHLQKTSWTLECYLTLILDLKDVKSGEYITLDSNLREPPYVWIVKFDNVTDAMLYDKGALEITTSDYYSKGCWGLIEHISSFRYSTEEEIALFKQAKKDNK